MTRYTSCCFFVLLFMFASFSQASEQELAAKLDSFLYGASVNDPSVHDDFWHADLVYTSSAGDRFGKTSLMQGVEDAGMIKESEVTTWYSADQVHIRLFGDVAQLDFRLVSRTGDTTQYYLNSGTFVRQNGDWRAINWHATKAGE
ncbi:nuclear transport factor 2 family protein [Lacimicrobium sp. SS2-24]|uniref:nuclear transport factor 2 family protein n=1 Tax=Lacimicrobium sp. SS2-24 TaxID=2005569 RepID=UPI000B4A96A5|nr:nuclear transport factor 2 family protein [Lacimicrobium sp. SS2-24]